MDVQWVGMYIGIGDICNCAITLMVVWWHWNWCGSSVVVVYDGYGIPTCTYLSKYLTIHHNYLRSRVMRVDTRGQNRVTNSPLKYFSKSPGAYTGILYLYNFS